MARDLIGPWLAAALVCAAGALDPPVERPALYPGGAIAWDDCCDGQVWVRLISLVPTGNPGGQSSASNPCGVLMWTATIGVGVLRCAAMIDDQGDAPTPDELNEDTLQMTADLAAISEALQCCLGQQIERRLTMLSWAPLGPEGGCVGGEWIVTMKIDNCACP